MKYLKVYTDFAEDLKELSDAETGRLFRAMLLYAAAGEEPSFGGNERFLWRTAKKNIDAQIATYTAKVRNMEAARNQNPNNQKPVSDQTEISSPLSSKAQCAVEEQEQEQEQEQEKGKKPPTGGVGGAREPLVAEMLAGYSEQLRAAIDEWLRYKREKRETYKPIGLKTFLNKIIRFTDGYGEKAMIDAIYDAMSSNYQGIVWAKIGADERQKPQRQGADRMQNRYNMMQRWANDHR